VAAAPLAAQQPAPAAPAQTPRPGQAPAGPRPAGPPAAPNVAPPTPQPPPAGPPRPEMIPTQNIRLEFTISDSSTGTTPTTKTVTLIIADGRNGRIRSNNNVEFRGSFQPVTINVDAMPRVRT